MLDALGTYDGVQLAQLRDQLYEALPAKGRRAQGVLVMWMSGLQPRMTNEQIDKIVTNPRVQFELKLPDVNGNDLSDAVLRAAYDVGNYQLTDVLHQPFERMLLMGSIGA